MAFPNTDLIEGLRAAASQLRHGAYYAWGHHGACNCGHLLQATTHLSKEEIVTYAHTGIGEWTGIPRGPGNIESFTRWIPLAYA